MENEERKKHTNYTVCVCVYVSVLRTILTYLRKTTDTEKKKKIDSTQNTKHTGEYEKERTSGEWNWNRIEKTTREHQRERIIKCIQEYPIKPYEQIHTIGREAQCNRQIVFAVVLWCTTCMSKDSACACNVPVSTRTLNMNKQNHLADGEKGRERERAGDTMNVVKNEH